MRELNGNSKLVREMVREWKFNCQKGAVQRHRVSTLSCIVALYQLYCNSALWVLSFCFQMPQDFLLVKSTPPIPI